KNSAIATALFTSSCEPTTSITEPPANFGARSLSVRETALNVLMFAGGSVMLVVGSQLLVKSAVAIAEFFGASSLIIGLTVIAFGTSLPELATSVMASVRGERDIAVGNVIGSNIFNILVVLGLTSAVSSTGIDISASAMTFDIPVMLAAAVMCFPIFFTDNEVSRREGVLLLSYYVLYVGYLVLHATDPYSPWAGLIGVVVVPLTVLMLVRLSWRTWQSVQQRRAAAEAVEGAEVDGAKVD
ncbi:MAG: sodium:calcium antiporter, partial [Cyanobacteria bacterium J06607_13]